MRPCIKAMARRVAAHEAAAQTGRERAVRAAHVHNKLANGDLDGKENANKFNAFLQ